MEFKFVAFAQRAGDTHSKSNVYVNTIDLNCSTWCITVPTKCKMVTQRNVFGVAIKFVYVNEGINLAGRRAAYDCKLKLLFLTTE